MKHSGFKVAFKAGFKPKLLYKEVDICDYEGYFTPLCLCALICQIGKVMISTSMFVVKIKTLSSVSGRLYVLNTCSLLLLSPVLLL